MASLLPGFEYDIFISYRHNDNRSGWVTEFVAALQEELAATIKEPVSVYFDKNPHDGLLETHHVDKSLEGKLKCLIFISIISQTYCDPKSFAWQHEFVAFNKLAQEDELGRDIKLSSGNVASRILPIKIHDLDADDRSTIKKEIGGVLRAIEFIFKSPGVNRPLGANEDHANDNLNKTYYKDQVNKVANAIKDLLSGLKSPATEARNVDLSIKISNGTTGVKNKKAIYFGIGLALILSLAYYFFIYNSSDVVLINDKIDNSLVVLPFEDMSPNKDQEWFSDGLSEELLNRLSRVNELRLISRTTAFAFKGQKLAAKKIADSLGVSYVLEGSVRKSGNQLRITAQLIRASDDTHVWSNTYDYEVDSIFIIQEDISQNITNTLSILLNDIERKRMLQSGTKSVEAYEEYLKGSDIFWKAHFSGPMNLLDEANIHFEKAFALDNSFSEAYFKHHDLYAHSLMLGQQFNSVEGLSDVKKYEKAMNDLESAIRYSKLLDDKANYQIDKYFLSYDWSKMASIPVNEYDLNKTTWGVHVLLIVNPQFVHKISSEKIALDPYNEINYGNELQSLIKLSQLDSALSLFEKIPVNAPWVEMSKSQIFFAKGEYQKAMNYFINIPLAPDELKDQMLLLKILSGIEKSRSNIESEVSQLDNLGGIIGVYNAMGEYAKADSLANQIDSEFLGHCSLSIVYTTYGLTFHLAATPNFTARLRELGIDPEAFEKQHYYTFPKVELTE